MKKILVTGATGFIGSFIVSEALRLGFDTWAAVRATSSRRYLQDKRIHFVELDLSDEDKLMEQLRPYQFDYIVHAAGVTKCIDPETFFKVNRDGTIHLMNAIMRLAMPVERIVYMSSLSVYGAIHEERPHQAITLADTPQPNTAYGRSKWEAEQALAKMSLPIVTLRPTGVYGPRETDYYMMAKSIKGHVDFAVGYSQQDITFVYVRDVVQAVFLALDHGTVGKSYFLSDGLVYQSETFSNLIHKELGSPWWIRIKAPIWLLWCICNVCERWSKWTGKMTALNKDKFNILKQRNWRCDIKPAIDDLGFKPAYDLERGVKETIAWYKDNGWL